MTPDRQIRELGPTITIRCCRHDPWAWPGRWSHSGPNRLEESDDRAAAPDFEYCGTTCPRSDRNIKQDFAAVDRDAILDALGRLPIQSWSYKAEETRARHIGPMAQDFMATFHVGSSDKTILQVDADGVALAAIQALNERVKKLENQNAELERELEALRTQRAREHEKQARR